MRVATRSTTSMPTVGVVAGEALADVVQQRADQEEVGPLDRVGQPRRQGRGFEQVPVDGEGVVGVALGLVAHGGPLGDQPDQQAVLVEGLELVDGGAARAEQRDEGRPGLARPGVARRRHAVGQTVQRPRAMGRSSSAAVAARRSGKRGVVGDRRASASGRSRRRRATMSGPRSVEAPVWPASGGAAAEASPGRRSGVPQPAPAPHVVARPRRSGVRPSDTASMSASASEKPSASATWSWSWSRSLSCSRRGHAVQLDADVGEERGRVLERGQVGVVGQQRGVGGDGAEHADVAQAAVALLQVGLQEEGDVAGAWPVAPPSGSRAWGGTWCPSRLRHAARGLLEQRFGQLRLAPDHAGRRGGRARRGGPRRQRRGPRRGGGPNGRGGPPRPRPGTRCRRRQP